MIKVRLLQTIVGVALAASGVFAQTPVPKSAAAPPTAGVGSTTDGQKTKIALLSFLALREAIGELKQRYDKLQSEFGPRANEIDSLQNSIEAKEKVLSENKGLTIQAARTLTDQVEQLKREYQRKLEDSQELARKRESEETAPVLEKISDFLEKYCQKYGITHVFDVGRLQETGVALYAAPGTNITEDFVKEYNKANPTPAAAAAKPPAGPTTPATKKP
jgi:outer membrane protein